MFEPHGTYRSARPVREKGGAQKSVKSREERGCKGVEGGGERNDREERELPHGKSRFTIPRHEETRENGCSRDLLPLRNPAVVTF